MFDSLLGSIAFTRCWLVADSKVRVTLQSPLLFCYFKTGLFGATDLAPRRDFSVQICFGLG